MRPLRLGSLTLCLALFAGAAGAKVHFINQGVKYHVGDDRYERSEDKEFVGTYPVVGQEWVQAFKVSDDDVVKVRIRSIWGVDDCPYCKVMVAIGDHDMGRLLQENNHQPFDTLEPLALRVKRGQTYLLRISSLGDYQVDDLVIEGVSVETAHADVIFLRPGPVLKRPEDPMPEFTLPVVVKEPGGCQVTQSREWQPGWEAGRPKALSLNAKTSKLPLLSSPLADLAPGEALDFSVRVDASEASKDLVSHPIEILVGGTAPSGWVLTLDGAGSRVLQANLVEAGDYSARSFAEPPFKPGQWNRIRVSFCADGQLNFEMNGTRCATPLRAGPVKAPLKLRSLGLDLSLAATSDEK